MPKYFLETDEAITGDVGGEFGNDKGAFGNATLKLFVRNNHLRNWTFVMQQDFAPVSILQLLIRLFILQYFHIVEIDVSFCLDVSYTYMFYLKR